MANIRTSSNLNFVTSLTFVTPCHYQGPPIYHRCSETWKEQSSQHLPLLWQPFIETDSTYISAILSWMFGIADCHNGLWSFLLLWSLLYVMWHNDSVVEVIIVNCWFTCVVVLSKSIGFVDCQIGKGCSCIWLCVPFIRKNAEKIERQTGCGCLSF